MKSRLLAACALFLVGFIAYQIFTARPATSPVAPPATADREPAAAAPPSGTSAPRAATPAAPTAEPTDPLTAAIDALLAALQHGTATPEDFAALKAQLLGADPGEAIAAIRAFLRSQRNAATRQEFAVGPGGTLTGAPTLRVLLLDVLGQIARRSRSPAAAEISREILAEKNSADEWALALRNVAWTDPQARPFLADRVREMLAYTPWRTAPSAGLLEALDVVVFTRDPTLIPALDEARTAGGELAHATDIALDRLAEAAPLNVLTWLNQHPRTLDDRPFLRADYFAKADLAQGAQRAQIEIYLARPDIAPAEKAKLLKALTAPASFVSDTLLSTPPPPDDAAARRTALSNTLADWLKTDRFPTLRPTLLETQALLAP